MRSKDAAFLALLRSDNLDLVVLLEIRRATTPLYYAIDTEPRTWNGITFAPTAGFFDEVKESAEREVPTLRMTLQNLDGVLGPIGFPPAGGEDLRGRRVVLRQGDRRLLTGGVPADRVLEYSFFINSYMWVGRAAVTFDLGGFPAELEVPNRTLQGLRCRWMYKGAHCGYVGDLPICAKTPDDCGLHFIGEPRRFGGFPGSADARAVRVS